MQIACVTGATGMIGRRIVNLLLNEGYRVRILTRKLQSFKNVDLFRGCITDVSVVDRFICGADAVFHCAAELHDESRMRHTNVVGTRLIIDMIAKYNVKYLCYMSSAGVIGKTSLKIIDEECLCDPKNEYEFTKLVAEKLVEQKKISCQSVILRPTNVVDSEHLGDLSYPMDGSLRSLLHSFIKGGECSHLVHAVDVARAALFFLSNPVRISPQKYFVSIDMDPYNTISGLWALHQEWALHQNIFSEGKKGLINPISSYLPISFPYYIRSILGKPGNWGDTRYSSRKLLAEGFEFSMGVREVVDEILRARMLLKV